MKRQKSQKTQCKCGAKKKLMIVKVGSDERPAGQVDIDSTQKIMEKALVGAGYNDVQLVVTHHAMEVDTYSIDAWDKKQKPTKTILFVQAPNADKTTVKRIQGEVNKLVEEAGANTLVYVTSENVGVSQFQIESK